MKLIYCSHKLKTMLYLLAILAIVLTTGKLILNLDGTNSTKDQGNTVQVVTKVVDDIITVASPDFFIEYRLERDKVRSERSELLRDIIKSAATEDARQKAQDILLKMVIEKQKECEIENLIKAKGFSDAMVIMRDNSVSAIVKSAALNREIVAQVSDIISRVSGIKAEDITISAKP